MTANRSGWCAGDIVAAECDPQRGNWLTVWGSYHQAPELHTTREAAQAADRRGASVAHVTEVQYPGVGRAYRITQGSLGPRDLSSTDLAQEIAASPRFGDDGAAYFDELAAARGPDLTGIAWIQACLAAGQGGTRAAGTAGQAGDTGGCRELWLVLRQGTGDHRPSQGDRAGHVR
jgi:hypothetical protein